MTHNDTHAEDVSIEEIIPEDAEYHSLLQVWRAILEPAEQERHTRITPQWANRIVNTHTGLTFTDMPAFRDAYFDKVADLKKVLDYEISTDDECLNVTTAEEDAEQNSGHFLNVLTNWQLTVLDWELEWDCTDPDAAIDLASTAEVHRMFFSETGLTALLDQIPFEFTDMHREMLAATLQAHRESRGEG